MSFEELQEHDIFLPKNHWDELDLSSSVNEPLLLSTLIFGAVSCGMMVFGQGGTLTWIGSGLFFLFMIAFTLVSNAGIDYQNDVVDRVMRDEDDPDAETKS